MPYLQEGQELLGGKRDRGDGLAGEFSRPESYRKYVESDE
jgi:hypothetical protein